MIGQLLSPLLPWIALTMVLATIAVGIRRTMWAVVAAAAVACLLGMARGALDTMPQLPAALLGQKVVVTGEVDDDPVDQGASRRITLRVDRIDTAAAPAALRIQATVFGLSPLRYGDLVVLTGVLERPPRLEQFDYRAYLAERGITAVLASPRLIRVTAHAGDFPHRVLFAARHAVVGAVDRALPEPQAALVLGVVFGYRSALPATLQQQMIASGLVHIVVASGLNIAMLARMVQRSLGRLWPSAASWIGLLAIGGYAVLSGASAAALRATLMGAVVIVASLLKRESHVAIALALTAALMLGLKPDLARDVSFQLSFGATLGIVLLADTLARPLGRLPGAVREALTATLAAQLITWPILLAQVHRLSLIAPLANLLVVPLVPTMMVLGGIGTALTIALPVAGWLPLQLAGGMARWFQAVIETTASFPLASIAFPYFPPSWLAAGAILNAGLIAAVKLRQFFWHRRVWLGLAALSLSTIALLLVRPDGRVHVYALDVGTGSAVLIRTANGHQILLDAGPDSDKLVQAIGRAVPPTARTIDVWLITGGRRTEIGGGAAVLSRFSIERMLIADPDPWSVTLRSLVQQAKALGIPVTVGRGQAAVDGVCLTLAGDERSWLIRAGPAVLAMVPPETAWESLPSALDGAIFTNGGPLSWQGPGAGFSVIQVSASSHDGLPRRAFTAALSKAPTYRTDRLGTVELLSTDDRFEARSN